MSQLIARNHPVVSADNHLSDPPGLWERLPEHLQPLAPHRETRDGKDYLIIHGARPLPTASAINSQDDVDPDVWLALGADELSMQKEHRSDPTHGLDHDVRAREQARDGVDAEVLYPNTTAFLYCSPSFELQAAGARAYNDWVAEWIRGREYRYAPAALIPLVDDIEGSIAEATRARRLGLKSVLLPPAVPWLPFDRPEYEPLWSALEDLEMIAAFHVFVGNNFLGTDFADVRQLDLDLLQEGRRRRNEDFSEQLQTTVMGMAAGMSPVVHLTGAGVLERHPRLRFVIVEAEIGWLGWVLQAMDQMQHRRRLTIQKLPLLPSEYFRRQGWATFIDDRYGLARIEFIGADRLLWSNDFPHDEGTFLESAATIAENFAGLDENVRRGLLWENAAALYGFEAAPLLRDREARTAAPGEPRRPGA